MIALADQFTGQYADRAAFMAALTDKLAIEMKRRNWAGAEIVDVTWQEPRPDFLIPAPLACLTIEPGSKALTLERVRAAFVAAATKRAGNQRSEDA